MSASDADLPLDYKWVDWEHLYVYVGRALIGDHVPMMTEKVAKYLQDQARDIRRAADRLDRASQVLRQSNLGPTVAIRKEET